MLSLANSIADSLKEPKDIMKQEIAVKNKNSIKKFANKNKLLNAAFHSNLSLVFLQIGHELKFFIYILTGISYAFTHGEGC